jgi:diketogulonate reductase-like aldo/keto reductase
MVGLTKDIGVSNFRIVDIERILKIARYKPVINQIEYHPYLQQKKLLEYLAENDILIAAYAPLAPLTSKKDGPLTSVIEEIGKKEGKTSAQVVPPVILLTTGLVEMVPSKGRDPDHHEWQRSTTKGTT